MSIRNLGQFPGARMSLVPIAAECTPPLDVLETNGRLEILVDLPGVPASAVEVSAQANMLVIAGEKVPQATGAHEAGFHLAERGFGRFVRTIRFDGAYDVAHATASLTNGELRIVLPRIDERRGTEIRIPIR